MPTCSRCDRTDSLTTINGVRACLDHLDEVMGEAFAPVRAFLEDL